MWLFNILPLFEAADKGGAGGGEEKPSGEQQPAGGDKGAEKKPGTDGGKQIEDEFFGNSGLDILKDAPEINPKTGEAIDQKRQESERSGEAGEEGAEKGQQQEKKAEGSEKVDQPAKVKLGDQEYSVEQIQEWKKAADLKENWEKKLTHESQLDGFLRSLEPEVKDAFLSRALADVFAKKDPKEYLKEGDEADLTLLFDEDGEEIEQTISPGTEQYKVLADHFEKLFLKKYQPAFVELKSHKEQLQSFHDEQQRFYKEASQRQAIGFLQKHPEIGIPVKDKMDLEKTLQGAVASGPTHPLYNASLRFYSLGKAASELGYKLEDYYNLMYGDFQQKKDAAQKITEADRQNQMDGAGIEPGKGKDAGPKDFIDALNKTSGTSHHDLVAEFDQGKTKQR